MIDQEPLDLCLCGEISPEVALARLLLLGGTPDSIATMLAARREPRTAWRGLPELLETRREALTKLAAEIAAGSGDHAALAAPGGGPAAIAAFFDRAVAHSAEASVALYSLADPLILAAATREIVDWLRSKDFLGGDVLDLGCGFGRIAAALSPDCRTILGLDVSSGMIAEARRRYENLHNLSFSETTGTDLDFLGSKTLDLALAIDSFPYIVQIGDDIAQAHFRGIGRALRSGGHLVVLNLSYRGNGAQDERDASRWATSVGLVPEEAGTRAFTLWDGVAYVFRAV